MVQQRGSGEVSIFPDLRCWRPGSYVCIVVRPHCVKMAMLAASECCAFCVRESSGAGVRGDRGLAVRWRRGG